MFAHLHIDKRGDRVSDSKKEQTNLWRWLRSLSLDKTPFYSSLCLSSAHTEQETHHSYLAHCICTGDWHYSSHTVSPSHHWGSPCPCCLPEFSSIPLLPLRFIHLLFVCLFVFGCFCPLLCLHIGFFIKGYLFVKGAHHGTGVEVGGQLGKVSFLSPWKLPGSWKCWARP